MGRCSHDGPGIAARTLVLPLSRLRRLGTLRCEVAARLSPRGVTTPTARIARGHWFWTLADQDGEEFARPGSPNSSNSSNSLNPLNASNASALPGACLETRAGAA